MQYIHLFIYCLVAASSSSCMQLQGSVTKMETVIHKVITFTIQLFIEKACSSLPTQIEEDFFLHLLVTMKRGWIYDTRFYNDTRLQLFYQIKS